MTTSDTFHNVSIETYEDLLIFTKDALMERRGFTLDQITGLLNIARAIGRIEGHAGVIPDRFKQ